MVRRLPGRAGSRHRLHDGALVDGFVLWLSDGEVAYRYHTDATGAVLRLAESGIALGEVAGAPLPEGAAGPAPPPEPATAARG